MMDHWPHGKVYLFRLTFLYWLLLLGVGELAVAVAYVVVAAVADAAATVAA